MSNIATLSRNVFPVTHTSRPEIGCEFLTLNVARGWDDVRKFVGRALSYEGNDYAYTGWNSDINQAYFSRKISGPALCAELSANPA